MSKSIKKTLSLISGFYKNDDVLQGLGIFLTEQSASAISNGQYNLNWFANAIAAEVSALKKQGVSRVTALQKMKEVIANHKNVAIAITPANVVTFLALVQFMEQRGWIQPDDVNGMLYQNELSVA